MPLWRQGFPISQIGPKRTFPFIYGALRNVSQIAPSIILRPYQETCLESCLDALKGGVSRIGVSLPTGSGKTAVFISLLSRMLSPAAHPGTTRALVIVNSIELARQAAVQAVRFRPDWKVEIEQGIRHKASGLADVTVATYQTLLQPQRLSKFDPMGLKAIVIDEAHHAAAPSYRRILSHFDPAIRNPDPLFVHQSIPHTIPIIGFSATFSRHDGLALGSVFQEIVYHRDFLDMIKEQWLCNVRFTTVRANLNLKDVTVNSRTGDFNPTSLAQVINTPTVNKLIVQTWLDRAANRKSTLVFCVNLDHVRQLTDAFRAAGIDARYVYAATPTAERLALINGFKAGDFPVLLNCAILTEGADIPNIDCVLVARPTRSRNIFAQMIGRGMRQSPGTGKTDCRIVDFVDIMDRVPGVVCTPSLFGLDPNELVDDETIDYLEERARMSIAEDEFSADSSDSIPEPKSVTYVDYDNPFSLVNQASGAPPHIMKLSPNAWVGCGGDIYVLECMGSGHIRIELVRAGGNRKTGDSDSELSEGDYYEAHFAPVAFIPGKWGKPLFQLTKEILKAETLADAVRGCDTYAIKKVVRGERAVGLLRTAAWRRQPATPNQKALVAKRWKARPQSSSGADSDEEKFPDRVANLTKGDAANIITRLKHGAQGRYASKMKAIRKAENAEAKEQLRWAREHVKVGRLPQEHSPVRSSDGDTQPTV